MADPAICRARLLSDLSAQTPCDKESTPSGGRLCAFHARQCQAMYRGYKKRNEELDRTAENQPPYLANNKTSIVVQEFRDVEDEATLQGLHEYLFNKYVILEKVIKARKLHHSHFYAVDMDYGHEKYLTKLLNDKHIVARALERLGKRGAEVVHQKKEWLGWVKNRQEEEESQRENESKKVKLEALLLKRHQNELQRQRQEATAKEQKEREEEYLNGVFKQRLSEMTEEEQDDWDPVQDVFGYERANYVDLIKFFLMLQDQDVLTTSDEKDSTPAVATSVPEPEKEKPLSKSAKKRAKKANTEQKKLENPSGQSSDDKGPKTIEMETKRQMRERLCKPVKYERSMGFYTSSSEGPTGFNVETKPIPEDELDKLLEEVAEVKHLLFCRLLLSQATLLPIALQSDSIEDFLADDNVTREHLRDLCLRLERPGLQDVRDACADFVRGVDGTAEKTDAKGFEEDDEDNKKSKIPEKYTLRFRDKSRLPEKYMTKREKAAKNAKTEQKMFGQEDPMKDAIVEFDDEIDETGYERKQTRIKVCGRYMYNYPSEKALPRGGWYHFSVIAKDSSLSDAIELCRNWNELFELNILAMHHYFPAPKWTRFVGDIMRQQLLQLGFIPYFVSDYAEKVTHYFQTGSRGTARRSHQFTEMRNFICGNVKRDDPVSRRFIQYLSMETCELRALVRDRKTGKILVRPPEEEFWLLREKAGWGRASKNEFANIIEIGPDFFETVENSRKWHFGFDEYYDVYVWDTAPGRPYFVLQRKVEEIMSRAIRVKDVKDMFKVCAPIFETITMEKETFRVRSIKPGEEVQSMWDLFQANAHAFQYNPKKTSQGVKEGIDQTYVYTEADEIEDSILFPEEGTGEMKDNVFRANPSLLEMFEKKPTFDLRRFARDLDSDEELSENDSLGGSDEDLEAVNDDGDEAWETETDEDDTESEGDFSYSFANTGDVETAMEILEDRFRSQTIYTKGEPDYFLSIFKSPTSAHYIPKSIRSYPPDLMATLRFSMRGVKEYRDDETSIEADFMSMLDREKSKVFKDSWHQGDLSYNAMRKEIHWRVMASVMDDVIMSSLNPGPFELCKFMDMAPLFTQERRIVDDAFSAYAAVALFFDTQTLLDSEKGQVFKNSNLIDQVERAKHIPDRRTHKSNKTMPRSLWEDWDTLRKDHNRTEDDATYDIIPLSWRKALRPAIIRLFKVGIIQSSYAEFTDGYAIAAAEPGRPHDLYIDWRMNMPQAQVLGHLADPTPFDRAHLLDKARAFKGRNPHACFSALRMWSAPHFYPLMLGVDSRKMVAFVDDRQRLWEFKFIPKDMPYSEWSVHHQLSLRLKPYRRMLVTEQVIVARDLILVMGRDRQECRRLSEGVTWAVTTRPWRLEIDFWRSFVGVELDFLEGLDEKWLE
ncbi:hypothetical protein PMIN06_012378 [Paraphaeosphaeria minitans]|uniref:Uncharacterized protein n=1 Tax=Paraphaeosphaeria minitans TaxID=565426 RepID=A0A9P6KSX7_9PLEO|nr:hypothetical protein PMIN01_04948 [Paraphaeosphaeria minitans]